MSDNVNHLLLSKTEYLISNSLRFRASNSAYLARTPGSAGNRQIFTYSAWVKRAQPGVQNSLYFGGSGSNFQIGFLSDDSFFLYDDAVAQKYSAAKFRDPSAWYHVVVAVDTTQSTASLRNRLYVNGIEITSFTGTNTNYSLNYSSQANNNVVQRIGTIGSGVSQLFDGNLSNVIMIDGQQLAPSSFGRTDATTGVWVPKAYAGTYGTNGFLLEFKDASAATAAAIGKDSSGNANNWTPSGISVTSGTTFDQMLDTPTLNYAVMNPLDKNTNLAFSEGNLTVIPTSIADYWLARATMPVPNSGKWYWELTLNNTPILYQAGIYSANRPNSGSISGTGNEYQVAWGTTYTYIQFQSNNAAFAAWGTNTNPTSGNVLMFAVDSDNGTMWVGRNGTWYNTSGTANPATNTDPRFSSIPSGLFAGVNLPNPASGGVSMNFGQRPFSYTPPTGFKALNTKNLTTPSIKKSSLFFDATQRTGTGATASVSSLGFQPDLVWIKSRSNATSHNLFDSSRGVQKGFNTNASGSQYTDANSLTAFDSNGYSLGSDASSRGVNINTNTYVDWAWKKGATPGFDIVTYTGNATNRTIAHSLGVVPNMMIIKNVDTSASPASVPVFYHSMLNGGTTPANYYMYMSSAAVEGAYGLFFNNTIPTSSVFTVGTDSFVNQNTCSIVAYLWSEVDGFSKIGSYTGNASTDGPFVWCGFRPKFLMIKARNLATSWVMANASNRDNEIINFVFSDLANADTTSNVYGFDLLSNGFKLRAPTGYSVNNSGISYLFAAYAETPFKYARAR